ncbi:MAG: glycosyltransferase family 4 protein [Burkholderiaceae bacterium]|nr:glycosyltransferase family 4 protein [Burkholderiaceae bacterium]
MNNKKLRIAHICLASSYTEGMLYQDNILPDVNRDDGHEVLVVSDCTCYVDGKITKTPAVDKILPNGVRLVRLEFSGKILPATIRNKLRYAPGLTHILEEYRPDVILHHSLVGLGLLAVGQYKKKNPATRLYLDSHADLNNSGQSILSRWLQYKIFNRYLWGCISKNVDKVLYVSSEACDFLRQMYRIKDEQLEFYPLGGFVLDEKEKAILRTQVREELSIPDGDIVFIHTGKMNNLKRTLEVMESFGEQKNENYHLLLAGVFENEIKETAERILKEDARIKYLGWQSGKSLINYLAASDCYLQPGSQSATLQAAICCGLPVVVYPYPSHVLYLNGNGLFVSDRNSLMDAMRRFNDKKYIEKLSDASKRIGRNLLDYRILAKRIY